MVHVALFCQNFQEIQQIDVDFSTKTVVQDLGAFRLGNGVAAQKLDKFRLLAKALVQGGHFVQNGFFQIFTAGELIQSLSVNASDLGHT